MFRKQLHEAIEQDFEYPCSKADEKRRYDIDWKWQDHITQHAQSDHETSNDRAAPHLKAAGQAVGHESAEKEAQPVQGENRANRCDGLPGFLCDIEQRRTVV